MGIHEYQVKEILARLGVPVPRGGLVYSPEQASYRATEIGGAGWVVKAQVHSGGRGEAGGVKLCRSDREMADVANGLFGRRLLTRQSGRQARLPGLNRGEQRGGDRKLPLAPHQHRLSTGEHTMAILLTEHTRVIVQGITGRLARFHTEEMLGYGTNIVGGVTPGKGGETVLGRPIFNTVKDAVTATGADASIVFVPPPFAADSIMEAADAGIRYCVCSPTASPPRT